jgi:hypothetical protein
MVGSPADGYGRRHPDFAVLGIAPPDAIFVEVLVAHHFWRDVSHGTRVLFALVAFFAPVVEIVAVTPVNLIDIGREDICTGQRSSLFGLDRICTTRSARLSFSISHSHDRAGSVFTGLQTIVPGLQNRKRLIGRIHFEDFVSLKASHADAQRTSRELNLNRAIIEVQKRETGVAVQTDCR